MTPNTSRFFFVLLVILALAGVPALAQPEVIQVPLSDPSKPARVEVKVMRGAIEVETHAGKDVVVQAIEMPAKERRGTAWDIEDGKLRKRDDTEEKADRAGLQRIPSGGSAFSVSEEDNHVRVRIATMTRPLHFKIKVPVKTSLELHTMEGDVKVQGVDGELELGAGSGDVNADRVAGTVLAETMGGNIKITMARVDTTKPMSFSTMGGDIELTLPANLKANLKISAPMGEILTDFDFDVQTAVERQDESDEDHFEVKIAKKILAKINGGGMDIDFKTFRGDVVIRKAK